MKQLNSGLGVNREDLSPATTLRNWKVGKFCSTVRCSTLSLRETLKASSNNLPTTTLRNRNVDDLLGIPLLERRVGYDRRHFHQLLCSPRSTTRAALWNPVKRDLGHGDNLLVQRRRIDLLHEFNHLFPLHLRHRIIEDLHEGREIHDVRRSVPQNPGSGRTSTRGVGRAARTSPSSSTCCTPCLPPWGEESSGPRQSSSRSPLSWPLPSSVSVELYGA